MDRSPEKANSVAWLLLEFKVIEIGGHKADGPHNFLVAFGLSLVQMQEKGCQIGCIWTKVCCIGHIRAFAYARGQIRSLEVKELP